MGAISIVTVGRHWIASTTLASALLISTLVVAAADAKLTEQTKLTAPVIGNDIASGVSKFGNSVAVSSDGNTALVAGDADGHDLGAAWVYTRSGTTWTEQKKLTAPTSGPDKEDDPAQLGYSVALSTDGSTAALEAPTDDAGGATNTGATWERRAEPVSSARA